MATSGRANGGAFGSFGRPFGFDGGDAWGASVSEWLAYDAISRSDLTIFPMI